MARAKVTKGQGTKFGYCEVDPSGDPTGFYQYVARVTDIGGVEVEADEIETTNHDSPTDDSGGAWKEFTAGLADGGEVEITIQFRKEDAGTIWALFRRDKGFQIAFPDNSNWTFAGFVKKFGQEVEREKLVTTKLTIRVSGKPVFVAAN